jgi:hypothetical protein
LTVTFEPPVIDAVVLFLTLLTTKVPESAAVFPLPDACAKLLKNPPNFNFGF